MDWYLEKCAWRHFFRAVHLSWRWKKRGMRRQKLAKHVMFKRALAPVNKLDNQPPTTCLKWKQSAAGKVCMRRTRIQVFLGSFKAHSYLPNKHAHRKVRYGRVWHMPVMSQCRHTPCSICQKRDPAVTLIVTLLLSLCIKSSLLGHIRIATQRDPAVTLLLSLCTKSSRTGHIRIATQRDPAVTLILSLCIKSSLLWHIRIATQRAWCAMSFWHIGTGGIKGMVHNELKTHRVLYNVGYITERADTWKIVTVLCNELLVWHVQLAVHTLHANRFLRGATHLSLKWILMMTDSSQTRIWEGWGSAHACPLVVVKMDTDRLVRESRALF